MPRCCSVSGCKSNYKSQNESVSTFVLPKEKSLRAKWIRQIPTDFKNVKNPIICIKHFKETDIIRIDKCLVNGEMKEFPRKIPKLKEGAIPSIFPHLPQYLSNTSICPKRLKDVEDENLEHAIKQSVIDQNEYIQSKSVKSTKDIISHFRQNESIRKKWTLLNSNLKVILCMIDTSGNCPVITASLIIENSLDFSIFIGKSELKKKQVPAQFNVLDTLNVFDDLLDFLENNHSKIEINKIQEAIDVLKSSDINNNQFEFTIEQLELSNVTANNRRYSGNTLILATTLYLKSQSAYIALYKSKCLHIPHPRNIIKLISRFSLNKCSMLGSIEYLKTKQKFLNDYELIVNLQLDEIYIEQQLNFKGDSVYGYSENDRSKIAKTAQVFMVSGILSKYKDVVSIVPVYNLTSEQLKAMIINVITEVEKIGFKIISLISDNNAINRKAFELLTENKILRPSIPHPIDSTRQLFLIFDSVHIIKCIRNNWISKKSENCTIKFPDMNTGEILMAQFKHLEMMYNLEKNSVVKYGHLLLNKVLYPSNIQKQNVKLALKVFDERNIVALKCVAEQHPTLFPKVEDTCTFLNIFIRWWKIVNVRSAREGKRFNDTDREPVRNENTCQLEFLKGMSLWLKNWRLTVPNSDSLSAQTFQAIISTNDAFVEMIPYMFSHYKLEYLLLGKFQTDDLEGRFGCYRQMSGSNYYISYIQLLESERKFRFKNMIILSCSGNNIPLKTLLPCLESITNSVNVDQFRTVVQKEFVFDEIPKSLLAILTYISGYSVMKELRIKKCNICSFWLQTDKDIDVNLPLDEGEIRLPFDLVFELDRGKLTLPTVYATFSVAVAWFTIQNMIDCCLDKFLSNKNQLSILHKISLIHLAKCFDSFPDVSEKCLCKKSLNEKLENINLRACKIFLNNLVKMQNNNCSSQASNKKKVKKLKSN